MVMIGVVQRWITALVLLATMALAGCNALFRPPAPPTDAQARTHLARIVSVAASGDLSTICELGGGNCPGELSASDPARVPVVPPVVVGTGTIQPTEIPGGGWSLGGYLLELCGIDGAGTPYTSEMLVFQEGDHLISINTLYWLGAGIADGDVTASVPADGPVCP